MKENYVQPKLFDTSAYIDPRKRELILPSGIIYLDHPEPIIINARINDETPEDLIKSTGSGSVYTEVSLKDSDAPFAVFTVHFHPGDPGHVNPYNFVVLDFSNDAKKIIEAAEEYYLEPYVVLPDILDSYPPRSYDGCSSAVYYPYDFSTYKRIGYKPWPWEKE